MSASLAVQLCRIIAPERLSDRFLSSGVLTASESRNLGDQIFLAYVFEVMQPWLPSARLLPALTATLEAEHAKLADPANQSSIDDKFELLLRAVNQTLNQVSEEGETDWIGNLNGIIMVLSGEELHFSQTGQCPAYLLQNNRIRQVTDDPTAQQDPHPLKTFSNLASGQLKDGDQLLVANHELYREISLDALRRILNTASPFQSAQAISKELKREKNPAVSTLILKFTANPPAQPEPESVILEEEMQSGFKKFSKRIAPFLDRAKEAGAKAGEMALATAKQTQGVIAEKVAPKVGEIAQKGKDFLTKDDEPAPAAEQPKEAKEAPPAEEAPADRPVVEIITSKKHREKVHLQAIAEVAEARVTQEEEDDDFASIIPDSERALEEKHTPESKVLHAAKYHAKNFLGVVVPIVRRLLVKLAVWLRLPGNRKKAALGGGVLILLLTIWIGVSASRSPNTPSSSESNSSILSDVRGLKDTIAGEIASQQTIQAAKNTETALTKLASLKDPNSSQQAEADNLWSEVSAHADTLNSATRLSSSAAEYSFTSEVRGLVAGLPYFYGWNPTSANLFRTGIGDPAETQTTVALNETNDSIISVARSSETDTAAYSLTKQGKVFRVVQNGSQTLLRSIAPVSGEFAAGNAIASYAGNVYILDGSAGLLWRYTNSGTTYAKGVSLIDINKYDIKKSISVAIDGSFYLLKNDGSLSKFTSGKEDGSFLLQNVPYLSQKLVQPISVVTNETFPNIYVLDAGATSSSWSSARVLIYGKDGSYVGQYTFPKEFTKVRAFDVNPKDKKLWILNDQTIHEFSL